MDIEKPKPKRKGKPYESMPRNGVFMVLVGLFLLVTIGINLAVVLYRQATETPQCGTRAGYQIALDSNADLYLTDRNTGETQPIADTSSAYNDVKWSPDGRWIALSGVEDDERFIRILDSRGDVHYSNTYDNHPDYALVWRWGADSETIYAFEPTGERWELLRWRIDNPAMHHLSLHEAPEPPEWDVSPDGTHVAVITYRDNRYDVELIDTTTGLPRIVVEDVLNFAAVEWSHDGQYVLLTNRDLYRITAADGTVTQLTSLVRADYAHWSPDDSRIAYTHRGGLYVIPSEGGDAQQLVESMVQFDFDWSPDGQWLLFRLHGDADFQFVVWDIGIVNVDGGRFMNLTQNGLSSFPLAWSADSQYILYQERDDATGDQPVYITNLATGETVQASSDSGVSARWSPDGRYVVVEIDNRLHLVEAATGERCIVHRGGSAYPYIWRPIPVD